MTSPAVAIYTGTKEDFSWRRVRFVFHTYNDNLAREWKRKCENPAEPHVWCSGQTPITPYQNNEERFEQISEWAIGCIKCFGINKARHLGGRPVIVMEDYALGARGRVFEIAENTGMLKQKMRIEEGWNFTLISPPSLKKFATGKGNADKSKMYDQWLLETGYNLMSELTPNRKKLGNPITDIVDAYYLLKYSLTLPLTLP